MGLLYHHFVRLSMTNILFSRTFILHTKTRRFQQRVLSILTESVFVFLAQTNVFEKLTLPALLW